ncbi:hypothetical protein E3C22_16435 [Jiella endophytica]|uniref:Uncharacterized protein n=1 Tax=Jiella endophytica TaxID=2558362 RepID=A0A4Y8RDW6_9HYPH|nr:hypothetical protein [Jiella endophytica]TFF20496.1 hypothetical protein E3C22_16435 [Jiella endophytica]
MGTVVGFDPRRRRVGSWRRQDAFAEVADNVVILPCVRYERSETRMETTGETVARTAKPLGRAGRIEGDKAVG